LARLITVVEQAGEAAREVGRLTHHRGGDAYTLGITGAPGAGKSTLADGFVSLAQASSRASSQKNGSPVSMVVKGPEVAVLAVDPSSPFTGGAILGDRVRMQAHALEAGVFIRSMATRGAHGGLALATPAAVRVLDAVGARWVLLETVGVGQVEVDVAGTADTTVVVLNPGWGDGVQASKAGLLEVADVFVVNKADRPGAAEVRRDLQLMVDLAGERRADEAASVAPPWRPPILTTVASTGEGVAEVWAAIEAHRTHGAQSGELARRRSNRVSNEIRSLVARHLDEAARRACVGPRFESVRDSVLARRLDPWTAADQLVPAFVEVTEQQ